MRAGRWPTQMRREWGDSRAEAFCRDGRILSRGRGITISGGIQHRQWVVEHDCGESTERGVSRQREMRSAAVCCGWRWRRTGVETRGGRKCFAGREGAPGAVDAYATERGSTKRRSGARKAEEENIQDTGGAGAAVKAHSGARSAQTGRVAREKVYVWKLVLKAKEQETQGMAGRSSKAV